MPTAPKKQASGPTRTPGQQARQTRGGRRTPAGDATGRERDRLVEESADALRARGDEITRITPPPSIQPQAPIVDYTDPGGVREIDPSELDDGLTELGADYEGDDLTEAELDDLPTGNTDLHPDIPHSNQMRTLDEPPAQGQPHTRDETNVPGSFAGVRGPEGQAVGVQEVEAPTVLEMPYKRMRVNTTLEDVTIGKDPVTLQLNNYTFEEGVTYKVPRHVYDHLDRQGYVWH